MLKVNNHIGLEDHLDKMVKQPQQTPALTHHTHTHTPLFLTHVWYRGKQHLMAFWVITESKASWESYAAFLASAPLSTLDLSPRSHDQF